MDFEKQLQQVLFGTQPTLTNTFDKTIQQSFAAAAKILKSIDNQLKIVQAALAV